MSSTSEPRQGATCAGLKDNVQMAADLNTIALPPRSVNPYRMASDLLLEHIVRAGWPWSPSLSLLVDGLDQAAEEHDEVAA